MSDQTEKYALNVVPTPTGGLSRWMTAIMSAVEDYGRLSSKHGLDRYPHEEAGAVAISNAAAVVQSALLRVQARITEAKQDSKDCIEAMTGEDTTGYHPHLLESSCVRLMFLKLEARELWSAHELPDAPYSGLVYFIQRGLNGPIKIGFTTKNPLERVRALQTGSPERLYLLFAKAGTEHDERALHQQFGHDRLMGEWFDLSDDLVGVIGYGLGVQAPGVGHAP